MLSTIFKNYGITQADELELIADRVQQASLAAGGYFLKAGQVSDTIGFITKGIVRVCFYGKDREEFTRYFLDEGNFIADISSFRTGIASSEYIQAVTDMELEVISKKDFDALSQQLPAFQQASARIIEASLAGKLQRISRFYHLDATGRYRQFLSDFPHLANRVPLQYIASFLGITPQSLSRIRKQLC